MVIFYLFILIFTDIIMNENGEFEFEKREEWRF
jgi:hypothetical protein